MKQKILIVEDFFIEANHLSIILARAGYVITDICRTFESAKESIRRDRPGMVVLDIRLASRKTGINLARDLNKQNIPFIYLSAHSDQQIFREAELTRPSGFILKPFNEREVVVSMEMAEYIYECRNVAISDKRIAFINEIEMLSPVNHPWADQMLWLVRSLNKLVTFDYAAIGFIGNGFLPFNALHFLRVGLDKYQIMDSEGLQMVSKIGVSEFALKQTATKIISNPVFFNGYDFIRASQENALRSLIGQTFGMHSNLLLPIREISIDGKIFFLSLYSHRSNGFDDNDLDSCKKIQPSLVNLIDKLMGRLKSTFPQVRLGYSVKTVASTDTSPFQPTFGQHHSILHALDLATQAAKTDISVLIFGETGTQKERLAESIHALSPRKLKPFVKINCELLPSALIDTELFGQNISHPSMEGRKCGVLEQAEGGTIFLQEVTSIPYDAQLKLLRFLQRRQVDNAGRDNEVRPDIRVIATTSDDLVNKTVEGKFRLDLYYWLNLSAIRIPALRERKEDIESIAMHFLESFTNMAGKRHILGFSKNAMKILMEYDWPGNVSELCDVVERSVLLAKGTMINSTDLPSLGRSPNKNLAVSNHRIYE